MKLKPIRIWHLFLLLLLYGVLVTVLNMDYNSVFYDETFSIALGRELLQREPTAGVLFMTGCSTLHPIVAASGDAIGGLYGARIMNMIIGLVLTVVVFLAARILFDNKRLGLVTAALFLFSGQTLYLMKLASYDILAALFLGTAFLMIAASEKTTHERYREMAVLSATVSLFFASVAKYLLPVFIPPLLLYVLVRHGLFRTMVYSVFPLTLLLVLYYFVFPFAPQAGTISEVRSAYHATQLPIATLADWAFRWIALITLLAVFGLFHRRRSRTALLLLALSTPIVIVHLVTRSEQSVNKNMIYAVIFLAPAAALGVDHLTHLFSMKCAFPRVKTFFTIAVLAIFWAYGTRNLHWLERQYPDVRPVVQYLEENGFDGMTVATNVWGKSLYQYSLEKRYPQARFMHIEELMVTGEVDEPVHEQADFIVCDDEFYGQHCPCWNVRDLLERNFTLVDKHTITLSWGKVTTSIYGRK